MFDKLEEVELRYNQIQSQLQEPGIAGDQKKYKKLMIEMADLEKVVVKFQEYKSQKQQLSDNVEMLSSEKDEELRQLIKEENSIFEKSIPVLEQELKILLLPQDPNDNKNVILEIRAGAGGDESSLFAEELFRGYTLYAQSKGWRSKILSISEGNAGGCKEVIASVAGEKVYSHLKYESGVHRVQRVPKTESQGRVHTSTVTVAVIPEVEETEINIQQKDLKIDVYRSSGHGGQSVNTTDSAVRITHLPTGLVVTCQDGKSQLSNKEQAMKVLYSRLQQMEEDKKRQEASDERLAQIGTGDRSERIRTYNFPQSRITDHRIGLTLHQLNAVMGGDFSLVIDALNTHYQAEAMKNQS